MKYLLILGQSLKPIVLILLVVLVFGSALFVNYRYQILKEQRLAAILTNKLDIESSCSPLTTAGAVAELKFTFNNKNNEAIAIKRFAIEKDMLYTQGRTFSVFKESKPKASSVKEQDVRFSLFEFEELVTIPANGKNEVTIILQTASRLESKASSHTIVSYPGEIQFDLEHEIKSKANCEIQVRYS